MIDVRFQVVGQAEIVRILRRSPELIRSCVIDEFVKAGNEIVANASARAPFNPRRKAGSGTHLRDAVHYRIDNPAGNPRLYVTPYTRTALHAHLLERGVEQQEIKVYRKVYATKLQHKFTRADGRVVWRTKSPNRVKNRQTFMYKRRHGLAAQPYFMPAVQAVGDVTARLQAALDLAARKAGEAA